jgi:hypothetical protein
MCALLSPRVLHSNSKKICTLSVQKGIHCAVGYSPVQLPNFVTQLCCSLVYLIALYRLYRLRSIESVEGY